MLSYNYNTQQLIFFTQNNNSRLLSELLILKGNFKNESHSFVVENFDYAPNEEPNEEFCVNSSGAELRGLIYLCKGKIAIRDLTEEERNQTEQFKNEQQGEFKELVHQQPGSFLESPWTLKLKIKFQSKWTECTTTSSLNRSGDVV